MPSNLTPLPSRDRLELVYRLSQTFNSSLNLNEVLNRVVDEVIFTTHAERGFVMLEEPDGSLSFRAARGIERQTIEEPGFQISRSVVEKVKTEGLPVLTIDAQKDDRFSGQHSIVALGLRSILCVPLTVKEKILGIVYVDNSMQTGAFNADDLDLLTAIAASAAVAIENAELFQDLQQSKLELEIAYDITLEGWAKALELRDQETEGHTRRVTELTLELAEAMGLQGEALVHIRRGSLLHDIGKMGIPDTILRKNGPLTTAEFQIMKKHPLHAYQMLSPIAFLRPAIDIPYCHHEKWDGSGYPRGLYGLQIPLAARLFAIVDVWDALRSVRPYHTVWPIDQTIDHIQDNSGKHFDPSIVQTFLSLVM